MAVITGAYAVRKRKYYARFVPNVFAENIFKNAYNKYKGELLSYLYPMYKISAKM